MYVDEFFDREFVNYASYDVIRSIPSVIDGLKNASRKIMWVVLNENIKTIRLDTLSQRVQFQTKYLHGSLESTVVGLAQDYTSCGLNLLQGKGHFGKRLANEAAASRYISVAKPSYLSDLFDKDDFDELEHQLFDGEYIEPRYLIPSLPLIALLGSEGIATGFASKILPRNIVDVVKYLQGKSTKLLPYYKGFEGIIKKTDKKNQYEISGVIERVNTTTVKITELPINYQLTQYLKILNKLLESKKIESYKDLSDTKKDKFEFIIKFKRVDLAKYTDEKLMDLLKLRTTVTENLTVLDESNKIIEFDTIEDLIDYWVNIKHKFNEKKLQNQILKYKDKLDVLENRIRFIKLILSEKIDIRNQPKKNIESQCKKYKLDKIDDTYDYLLSMQLWNLTKEKIQKLEEESILLTAEISKLMDSNPNELWLESIKKLKI